MVNFQKYFYAYGVGTLNILGVYYELNEHIDMNPLKSCQASSDTSLEYQPVVVWLQMARTGSKMAQKGQ